MRGYRFLGWEEGGNTPMGREDVFEVDRSKSKGGKMCGDRKKME